MIEIQEHFWAKVNKSGPLWKDTSCWLWTAGKNGVGYGSYAAQGQDWGAHRLAYEDAKGPIPEGFEIDHLCRVRNCVNPEHLEAVTKLENMRRGRFFNHKREITHCPQGHPYDLINTYWRKSGGRGCRACNRLRQRKMDRRQYYREWRARQGAEETQT